MNQDDIKQFIDMLTVFIPALGTVAGLLITWFVATRIAVMKAQKTLHDAEAALATEQKTQASAATETFANVLANKIVDLQKPLQDSILLQNNDLKTLVADLTADRDSLKTRLVALEATINTQAAMMKRDNNASEARIGGLEQDIKELRKAADEKDSRLRAANDTIASLRGELTQANDRIQAMQAEIDLLKHDMENMKVLRAELETKLAQAEKALADEKARADKAEARVTELVTELADLRKHLPENKIPADAPTVGTPDSAPRVERVE